MERRVPQRAVGGGSYFAAPKSDFKFIRTGCKNLDLALGGGWVKDRIGNVVGDKSSGKTLLMIEACANFAMQYPKGKLRYREAESAFDKPYAGALGMPLDRIDFGQPLETIEDLFEDLEAVIKRATQDELYILDSLDALSDRGELERNMDEGSYGTAKAKNLSQLLRRLVRRLNESCVTVLIVSQVRSKIGLSFGRSTTRSGGRALDFYASQVLYLTQLNTISRTISNVKRPVGVNVRAKVDKNKVSLPFREAQFEIKFGYGVDDLWACVSWLKEIRKLKQTGAPETDLKAWCREVAASDDYDSTLTNIHTIVEREWYAIEQSFMPTRRKYSNGIG